MSEPAGKKRRTKRSCGYCETLATPCRRNGIVTPLDWKAHRLITAGLFSPISPPEFDWSSSGLTAPTKKYYIASEAWIDLESYHLYGYESVPCDMRIRCGLSEDNNTVESRGRYENGLYKAKCLVCFPEKCWFCDRTHVNGLPVCCCCVGLLMKLCGNLPRCLLSCVFDFLSWERRLPKRLSAQPLIDDYEKRNPDL